MIISILGYIAAIVIYYAIGAFLFGVIDELDFAGSSHEFDVGSKLACILWPLTVPIMIMVILSMRFSDWSKNKNFNGPFTGSFNFGINFVKFFRR